MAEKGAYRDPCNFTIADASHVIAGKPEVIIQDAIKLVQDGRVVAAADIKVDLTRVPPEHHLTVVQIAMQSGVGLYLPSRRPPDPEPPQKAAEPSWWHRLLGV